MRSASKSKRIEKDDPQPVTLGLLRRIANAASKAEAAAEVDPDVLACKHPRTHAADTFCGDCGGLLNVGNIFNLASGSGAAFVLQQFACGAAIVNAQQRHAHNQHPRAEVRSRLQIAAIDYALLPTVGAHHRAFSHRRACETWRRYPDIAAAARLAGSNTSRSPEHLAVG